MSRLPMDDFLGPSGNQPPATDRKAALFVGQPDHGAHLLGGSDVVAGGPLGNLEKIEEFRDSLARAGYEKAAAHDSAC